MSNVVLVTVMIREKECTKWLCSQGDCEYNPTVEIRAVQYLSKIREQNKRTGLNDQSGF